MAACSPPKQVAKGEILCWIANLFSKYWEIEIIHGDP